MTQDKRNELLSLVAVNDWNFEKNNIQFVVKKGETLAQVKVRKGAKEQQANDAELNIVLADAERKYFEKHFQKAVKKK